jgi:adenine-specific DNA methylase
VTCAATYYKCHGCGKAVESRQISDKSHIEFSMILEREKKDNMEIFDCVQVIQANDGSSFERIVKEDDEESMED